MWRRTSCPHVRAKDARPTNDGWRRQVLVGTFGTCSGLTLYSCRPFTFHESTPALAVYFRTDCVVEGSSGTSFWAMHRTAAGESPQFATAHINAVDDQEHLTSNYGFFGRSWKNLSTGLSAFALFPLFKSIQ